MKNIAFIRVAILCGSLLLGSSMLNAADVRTYQVTGPVLALTATSITVQKGNEKWEIARNNNTKISGVLKVGAKVTIYYRMTAADIEVKNGEVKK
jgi:hypothetical protein